MPRYSEEFREQIVRKMMPPQSMSVAQGFCRKLRKDRHSIGADRTIGSPWLLSSQTVELIYEAALRNRAHLSLADHLDDFNTLEGGMC